MARARKKAQVDIQIPAEFEDRTDGWKNAYKHAFGNGCSSKAAALYADSHGDEEEFGGEGVE